MEKRARQFLTADEVERLERAVDWTGCTPPTRREVIGVLHASGEIMTTLKASDYVGLGWRAFRELRMRCLFRPCWVESGPAYYFKAELDAVLRRLRGDAPLFTDVPEGHCDLAGLSKKTATTFPDLLSKVIDAELRCVGVLAGRRGVSAMIFQADAIGSARSRVPPGALSSAKIADVLSIHPTSVRILEDARLLDLTISARAHYCTRSALERFDRHYVSSRFVATSTGRNLEHVSAHMAAAGFSTQAALKHGEVYRREHVDAVFGRGSVPRIMPDDS